MIGRLKSASLGFVLGLAYGLVLSPVVAVVATPVALWVYPGVLQHADSIICPANRPDLFIVIPAVPEDIDGRRVATGEVRCMGEDGEYKPVTLKSIGVLFGLIAAAAYPVSPLIWFTLGLRSQPTATAHTTGRTSSPPTTPTAT